uniref:Uncharacterized protein n=1 Tax=Anguilla anguilla TaxID=7936 RepID=A0A0E9SK09_ANGAN
MYVMIHVQVRNSGTAKPLTGPLQ